MFGLILAAAAVVAGVVGSVYVANQSRKATQEANEANAALMREQQAYQTSERLAAQEYNTPVNQRARFEAAGINPYMALGNVSAGNTEAMSGVETPTMQAAPDLGLASALQEVGNAPSKFSSIIQGAQQIQANKEAIESARTQNVFLAREKLMELNKQQADITLKLSQAKNNSAEYDNLKQIFESNKQMIERQRLELKYAEDYYSARNKRERNEADLIHEQQIGQWIKNRIESIHSQYAARIDAATLKRINAEASNQFAQMQANKQLSSLYSEKTKTEFDMRVVNKAGVKLDNEKKNVVNHYLSDMINVSLESQRLGNRQKLQDIENPFKYIGGAALGMLGGALGGAFGGAAGAAAGSAAGAGAGYSTPNTSYGTPSGGWSQLGY